MNNIGMLTELELKDRLYTVRQQKRVLEDRLEKYTFRCQIISNSRKEIFRQIRGGIVPALFYVGFMTGMGLMLVYCIKVTLEGGAVGNRIVGCMYLITIPAICYGIIRIVPKLKNMLMVFCNCFILKKEEGSLFSKMGDLCKEIDSATEEIRGLNEQLERLKTGEKQVVFSFEEKDGIGKNGASF